MDGVGVSTSTTRMDLAEDVEGEVARLLETRTRQAAAYGSSFVSLWRAASDCVLGGKLLRPRFLIGAFEALATGSAHGAAHRDSALRIAAGIELLHYSFLLHDDVIDGDLLRRGRPNLIGTVLRERDATALDAGARAGMTGGKDLHWAQTSGILMGDLLLAAAHQVFAREALPGDMRARLLDLLDHTITESVVGEQLDVGLSDGVLTPELNTVLAMSRLKTATYSFELPLRAAAILAGASPQVEATLHHIGTHLGVAFQLQDDLLSTFGCAREHGKDAFSDLREGKETAIIAYARMTDAWPEIEPWFGRAGVTEEEGYAVRALLIDCGAERFIRTLIGEQVRACTGLTSSTEARLPSALVQFIGQLVESLEERRS